VRIAIISTPFVPVPPPGYGGTELIVSSLVEDLVRRGHHVRVYATGDSYCSGELRYLYDHAQWPPNGAVELAHTAHALHDLLASEPFDVIHAHTPQATAFARLIDTPIIYTIHHDSDEGLTSLYRTMSCKDLHYVAISERQRELLGGTPEAKVIHHGLDTSRFPVGKGHGGYVAFLGRFAPQKGAHTAIEVAVKTGVAIHLAGQPHWKDEAYFRAEVEPRLRKPGVRWLGEADLETKTRLLGNAVATLFPITWEEPFGLVMIESMLCGTPVLAFDRGAAREVIDDRVTGWIVKDEDEMGWWVNRLARGTYRFDRGRCAARAAQRFSSTRMVDEYVALYTEAARGRSHDAPGLSLVDGP
jgi:glycosyltransferase involved in cell wall biosynthesis